jgi:hypothetical protein
VPPVILINQGPSVKEECHGCGEENVVGVFFSIQWHFIEVERAMSLVYNGTSLKLKGQFCYQLMKHSLYFVVYFVLLYDFR